MSPGHDMNSGPSEYEGVTAKFNLLIRTWKEVVVVVSIQAGKFLASQEGLCSIPMFTEVPIFRSYGMWLPVCKYQHFGETWYLHLQVWKSLFYPDDKGNRFLQNYVTYLSISIYLWLYSPYGPWPLFQFLNLYKVGRTPWTGDEPVARPLPTQRTTQTQKKRTQTSIPRVGFEPTIPVFGRAKTVHALDRAATVIGELCYLPTKNTCRYIRESCKLNIHGRENLKMLYQSATEIIHRLTWH
jgi:hypothetical protein